MLFVKLLRLSYALIAAWWQAFFTLAGTLLSLRLRCGMDKLDATKDKFDALPEWDEDEEDCQDWLKREIAKGTPFVISSRQLQQIEDELERVWGYADGG
jgi:hypothetical protein